MIERINVQVFIFTRSPELRFLILKRIPEKSGYWQPVCGGVHENEKYIQAVKREAFEETGIEELGEIIDIGYSFTYREEKDNRTMLMQDVCFAAEIKGIVDIRLSGEHEAYVWCSIEEARQYLKWQHNLIALERLIKLL